MNWSEYPGFKRLRFDTELTAFDGFLSLYLNAVERAKNSGKKIIAGAPLSPVEPVYAAGAVAYDPFSLETIFHAVMNEKTDLIDEAVAAGLSPDFSSWNLIAAGAVAAKKNQLPIDAYSTICGCSDDQVKKSLYAMSSSAGSPLYFWEVPRYRTEFSDSAVEFISRELKQLFLWLSSQTGHKITSDALMTAIRLGNLLRQDINELTRMQQSSPAPIPSLEYYLLQSTAGDYMQDGEALHARYQSLINELRNRISRSESGSNVKTPEKLRVYWVGEETLEYQIFNILEDFGAVLVGCDTRHSFYYEPVPEAGNPIENLAKWVWKMPCNLSTLERMKITLPIIWAQKPDAVLIHSVIGSRNFAGAERLVRDIIESEMGIPVLSIETSLPLANIEKVRSQIKAFIERNKPSL